MKVTIDDRERRSGIVEVFEELKTNIANYADLELEVKRLSVGDYIVDDKLVFERKTLADFAISIVDGRLFKQASRLVSSHLQPVLILEGTSKDLKNCEVRRESIQGAMINISLIYGIPILRSMNVAETAKLMLYAAKQVQYVAEGAIQRHGYRPKGKYKRQLFILQGLPGVGKDRAKQLLDKFETVENIMKASYDDLQKIEGIGAKTAENIRNMVSEELEKYE